MATKQTVNVYFCGGAALSISRKVPAGLCNKIFIDSAVSDCRGLPRDDLYLVEGMDGAGKDQAYAYKHFQPIVKDILIAHKPSPVLNIVVSSISGGSGSVMGALLAGRLLEEGKTVICVGVESVTSGVEVENSIFTMLSYKGVANKAGRCLSILYVSESSKADADDRVVWFLKLMSLITDKEAVARFDSKDLGNFIDFPKTSAKSSTVSVLEISKNEAYVVEKGTAVASTVHITTDDRNEIDAPFPEHLSKCLIVAETETDYQDLRLDNIIGQHALLVNRLESLQQKLADEKTMNKVAEVQVRGGNDDGLVFSRS